MVTRNYNDWFCLLYFGWKYIVLKLGYINEFIYIKNILSIVL